MQMHIRLAALFTLAHLFAAGCDSQTYTPQVTTVITETSRDMVSIELLAARSGLRIDQANTSFVTLKNSANTVTIFTYSNGEVYVNGESVCSTGRVTQVGGQTYVNESIEQSIRAALIAAPIDYSPPQLTGTVVIDPGHGGKDPGATSATGYYEKDINLQLARKVASILRARGLTVVMTRDNDIFLELEERAAVANRYNPELFVSIHHDSHPDSARRGYTVYVARSPSIFTRQAARTIVSAMSSLGLNSYGVSAADYRVLVQTRCPAVLIEAGHLSNRSEAALLGTPDFQDRLAAAIAAGIASAVASR
jgi:N-acetylmuramoyl-L-alanine amidase